MLLNTHPRCELLFPVNITFFFFNSRKTKQNKPLKPFVSWGCPFTFSPYNRRCLEFSSPSRASTLHWQLPETRVQPRRKPPLCISYCLVITFPVGWSPGISNFTNQRPPVTHCTSPPPSQTSSQSKQITRLRKAPFLTWVTADVPSIAKVHSLFLRCFSNLSSFRPDLPRVWKSPPTLHTRSLFLISHCSNLVKVFKGCSGQAARSGVEGLHDEATIRLSQALASPLPTSLLGINVGVRATLSMNPLPWEKPEEAVRGSGCSVPLAPFYQSNFLGQHSHRTNRSWPHSFLTHT